MAEVMDTQVTDKAPVRIGGVEITPAAIAAEVQNHPARDADRAWHAAAEALVVRQLLLDEARRLGVESGDATDPDGRTLAKDDALVEALIEREVTIPKANEAEALRFYARHRDRFTSETLVEAEHILLPASPDDTIVYNMAVSDARALIRQIEADPGSFEDLARQHSACPSKEQGGNLGQIGKGQTVPEFEQALFALAEGELCPTPVRSPYGIHVIRARRRADGQQLPFEAVEEVIKDYLEEASFRRAMAQYLSILAGRTVIEGVDLPLADGPLVQ